MDLPIENDLMGFYWDLLGYHLVMTNGLPWYRWPIEIDGIYRWFTILNSMGGSFHGELLK